MFHSVTVCRIWHHFILVFCSDDLFRLLCFFSLWIMLSKLWKRKSDWLISVVTPYMQWLNGTIDRSLIRFLKLWRDILFVTSKIVLAEFETCTRCWSCFIQLTNFWGPKCFFLSFSPLVYFYFTWVYRGNFFAVPVYNDILGLAVACPVVWGFPRSLKTNGWLSSEWGCCLCTHSRYI